MPCESLALMKAGKLPARDVNESLGCAGFGHNLTESARVGVWQGGKPVIPQMVPLPFTAN
jgi:hypothetical protein